MPRGRRPYPWIKLWFEMLNDPKMNRLSIAERGCWVGLLLLAGQSPERGKLMLTNTRPMAMDDIVSALHLTKKEISALENCISKLVDLNSLKWNGNCLEVINFKRRQEVYESDIREDEFTPNLLPNNSEITPNLQIPLNPPNTPLISPGEAEGRREKKDVDITSSPDGEEGRIKPAATSGACTPAGRYLFEKTGRKRWNNLVQKEHFEKAEADVGSEAMKGAIDWALLRGISNIQSIITAAQKNRKRKEKSSAEEKGGSHDERTGRGGPQDSGNEGWRVPADKTDREQSVKARGWEVTESGPAAAEQGDL